MPLSTQITHGLVVLALILACALTAVAGPLPPCVKAVSSNNGSFLVISDVQLESEHGNGARVQQVSLQVLPKENFINAKDRVTSPATYWTPREIAGRVHAGFARKSLFDHIARPIR